MAAPFALVITSIAGPQHPVLNDYARTCRERGIPFYVMGDRSSPAEFQLDGCDFYSLQRQRETGFAIAGVLPEKHYSRKNIGYLLAIREGADILVETDDDNYALADFWMDRQLQQEAHRLVDAGWVNVYAHFTQAHIWPRGFALEHLQDPVTPLSIYPRMKVEAPIQQGLADENPDVDAIYRLTLPLPFRFDRSHPVALGNASWCPFNSQNTTWFRQAFPLLYLPSFCSFRMTDIWRSFVAQRIAYANGWHVLFHAATVYQERNMHNLMRDFSDEIPGYLNNKRMIEALAGLTLKSGVENLGENLLRCYEKLTQEKWVGSEEMPVLNAWLEDIRSLGVVV